MQIPEGVSFEAAASVGVGIATSGYGLYKVLGLPMSGMKLDAYGQTVFIYGGSTATGTLAIQLAKL